MDDAVAKADGQPHVGQAGTGPHHWHQVRGVGDGTVHHRLNFGGGKAGEGLHAGLQVGRQAVQVPGEEFLAEAGLDAVPGPGRHLDHALHRLVGTDQQPVPLLAQVEGAICKVTREGGMGFSSEK